MLKQILLKWGLFFIILMIKKLMKKRFSIARYIFLALSILTNAFLILYSCLSAETTAKWNLAVTNMFAGLVNTVTEKEVKTIPIEQLDISLSSDNYNNILGYQDNEIPLGSSKEIVASFFPNEATDKSVSYYTDNTDIVVLNQSGSKVSIIGMKEGTAIIHAKNQLSGLDKTYEMKVVSTVAPVSYTIGVEKTNIPLGSQETILFDIDGGALGHNELLNFRYYDTRKLTYESSNQDVAVVNNYGVIIPKQIGSATITVRNNDYSKQLEINIVDGIMPSAYTNLHIEGSDVCYGNDMLNDQNSGNNNYPLSIYDGNNKLNNNDFIWESSNELLVKIDNHGVMRGFRKSVVQDEDAIITATSKITNQSVSFNIKVKEELPTVMNHWIVNGEKTTWGSPKEYTACVGDNLTLNTQLTPTVSNKNLTYDVSNPKVIECTYQGSSLSLRVVRVGTCTITISSISNPDLVSSIKFTVLKAGSINTNDLDDVGHNLRKSLGHASLFAVAEVFTLLALFMFLYDKKHWLPLAISLGVELVVSSISEIIQCFVPGRFGGFVDVCINMSGALVAAAIMVGIYFIIKTIKKKDSQEENSLEENVEK